jgi:tetratricopeptide (TPR) repeat protein
VKIPLLYEILIVLTLLIVIGVPVSIWRLIQTSKKDVELALESEKSSVDADRKAGEARAGYQRELIMNRDARAGEALGRARAAMARVTPSSDPKSPDIAQALNEAFVGYNMYLDVNPDDAAVRVERAKTHELRRNYDLAIADLERVIQLQPASAKMFQDKIAQLRLFLARTPK